MTPSCFLTRYFHHALQLHSSEPHRFRSLPSDCWMSHRLATEFHPMFPKTETVLEKQGKRTVGQGALDNLNQIYKYTHTKNRHSWILPQSSVLGKQLGERGFLSGGGEGKKRASSLWLTWGLTFLLFQQPICGMRYHS